MRCLTSLQFLVGTLFVLGLLPYHIKMGRRKVVIHKFIQIYGFLLLTSIVVFILYMFVNYKDIIIPMPDNLIDKIVMMAGIMCTLLMPLFTAIYFLIYGTNLAAILSSVLNVTYDKINGGNLDWKSLCYFVFVFATGISVLFPEWSPEMPIVFKIYFLFTTLYISPIHFIIPFFYQAVLLLLDQVLKASFTFLFDLTDKICSSNVNKDTLCALCIKNKNRTTISSHEQKASLPMPNKQCQDVNNEDKKHGIIYNMKVSPAPLSPSINYDLQSARCCLCTIDHLTEDITSHLGPIIGLELFNELVLIINFLVGVNENSATLTVSFMIYMFMACLRAFVLLNAPEVLRKTRQDILRRLRWMSLNVTSPIIKEEVIKMMDEMTVREPQYSVLGAFTLGRHCIISMLSTIMTYIVIVIQFRLPNTTPTTPNNTTPTTTYNTTSTTPYNTTFTTIEPQISPLNNSTVTL